MNVNVYLNHKEVVDVCTKFKCNDGELAKVVKATILGHHTSKFFRNLGVTKEAKPIDEKAIINEYLANTEMGQIAIMKADAISQPILVKE